MFFVFVYFPILSFYRIPENGNIATVAACIVHVVSIIIINSISNI